jgi:transposase
MQLRACALGYQGMTAAQVAEKFRVKKNAIKLRRRRARKRLRAKGLDLPEPRRAGTRHIRMIDVRKLDQAA